MIRTTHRRTLGDLTSSQPGSPQPSAPLVSASLVRASTMLSSQQRDALRAAITPTLTVIEGPTYNAPATQERCDCLINKLDTHLITGGADPITWQERGGLHARCAADWGTFVQFLVQEAGMPSLTIDSCRPWYQRRTLWAAGGVVAVLAIGGALVFGGGKRKGKR